MKTVDGHPIKVGLRVYWPDFGWGDEHDPIDPTIDSGVIKNNGFFYVERDNHIHFYYPDEDVALCADEKTAIALALKQLRKHIRLAQKREQTLVQRLEKLNDVTSCPSCGHEHHCGHVRCGITLPGRKHCDCNDYCPACGPGDGDKR